jgi:hypothetical protein
MLRALYIVFTEKAPDWCKAYIKLSFWSDNSTCAAMATTCNQSFRWVPAIVLLNSTLSGMVERTERRVTFFLQTIPYKFRNLSLKLCWPYQLSSQKRNWDPSPITKEPKWWKVPFIFIRPAQKWEFLKTYSKCYNFRLMYWWVTLLFQMCPTKFDTSWLLQIFMGTKTTKCCFPTK